MTLNFDINLFYTYGEKEFYCRIKIVTATAY